MEKTIVIEMHKITGVDRRDGKPFDQFCAVEKKESVDYTPVFYKAVPTAAGKIITLGGATLSAEIVDDPEACVGYVPHWATCHGADKFRRGSKC